MHVSTTSCSALAMEARQLIAFSRQGHYPCNGLLYGGIDQSVDAALRVNVQISVGIETYINYNPTLIVIK